MRMNSASGKAILSLVREGDYAHPGEEQAIDLVFRTFLKKSDCQVLDLGCGRGGLPTMCRGRAGERSLGLILMRKPWLKHRSVIRQ